MQNKLFIALDIDGVLNSRHDYSRFSDINDNIVDLSDKLKNEIKFSKMTNGRFCYGNFVLRALKTVSSQLASPILKIHLKTLSQITIQTAALLLTRLYWKLSIKASKRAR